MSNPFGKPKRELYYGQDDRPNPYREIIKEARKEKSYAQMEQPIPIWIDHVVYLIMGLVFGVLLYNLWSSLP